MKKTIFALTIITAASLVLLSCNNSVTEKTEEKCAKISGKIVMEGAYPKAVDEPVETMSLSGLPRQSTPAQSTDARTASPSFNDDTIINGNPEYPDDSSRKLGIRAYKLNEEGRPIYDTPVEGTVTDGTDFSISLNAAGDWQLEAHMWGYLDDAPGNSAPILLGRTNVTVKSDFSTEEEMIEIIAVPQINSEISGTINLSFSDRRTNSSLAEIKEVRIEGWKSIPQTENKPETDIEALTGTFVEREATVTGRVPGGCYQVNICFYDNDDKLMYKFPEVINVFSGFETNTWKGGATNYQPDDDNTEKIIYCLTDDMIASQSYENVPDTKILIYEKTEPTDTSYTYWAVDSVDEEKDDEENGINALKSADNLFCFDKDGNIYALSYDTENKVYVVTRNDWLSDGVPLTGITNITGITINRSENIFYAFYAHETDNNTELTIYKISKLISDGGSYNPGDASTTHMSSMDTYTATFTTEKTIFYACNDHYLYVLAVPIEDAGGIGYNPQPFYHHAKIYEIDFHANRGNQAGGYDLLLNYATSYDLNLESRLAGSDRFLSINDMIYQDEALYILANMINTEVGYESANVRGGIIEFSLFGKGIRVLGWNDVEDKLTSNGSPKELYTYARYNYSENGNKIELVKGIDDKILVYKLPTSSQTHFLAPSAPSATENHVYAPKKFIAIKPKKLVIADDGICFYTDSNGVFGYKNVDQIVTVDLESFAIEDATTTNSIFAEHSSATYQWGCSFGVDTSTLYDLVNKEEYIIQEPELDDEGNPVYEDDEPVMNDVTEYFREDGTSINSWDINLDGGELWLNGDGL